MNNDHIDELTKETKEEMSEPEPKRKKDCPFSKQKSGIDFYCDLGDCAWYDEINNQCAIITIARSKL
jgi:hypothetical protein